MAHSPSGASHAILHSQNQREVSDSSGYRSLPLALLWAHIHPLPGILLCTLHDGIQNFLQFIELSPLPRRTIEAKLQQTLNAF